MAEKQEFVRAMAALSSEEVVSMLPQDILDKVVSKSGTSLANDAGALASVPKKALKAVNAFIAFRSYYSKSFPAATQKDISSLIKTLWQGDAFHAEWQIMAQVWSFIRDSNTQGLTVPLGSFLATVVPVMGVVPNDAYVRAVGWQLTGHGNAFCLIRMSNPSKESIQATRQPVATSQVELMNWLSASGSLGRHGETLLARMQHQQEAFVPRANNQAGANVQHFSDRVRADPVGSAAAMFGVEISHPAVNIGVGLIKTRDFNALNMEAGSVHTPFEGRTITRQVLPPIPIQATGEVATIHRQNQDLQAIGPYQFDANHSHGAQSMFAMDDDQSSAIDIDNPFSVDQVLGEDSDPNRAYMGHQFLH